MIKRFCKALKFMDWLAKRIQAPDGHMAVTFDINDNNKITIYWEVTTPAFDTEFTQHFHVDVPADVFFTEPDLWAWIYAELNHKEALRRQEQEKAMEAQRLEHERKQKQEEYQAYLKLKAKYEEKDDDALTKEA